MWGKKELNPARQANRGGGSRGAIKGLAKGGKHYVLKAQGGGGGLGHLGSLERTLGGGGWGVPVGLVWPWRSGCGGGGVPLLGCPPFPDTDLSDLTGSSERAKHIKFSFGKKNSSGGTAPGSRGSTGPSE